MGTGLTQQQRIPGVQSSIAVYSQPEFVAHSLPYFVHYLDIYLYRPAAYFYLHASVTFSEFFCCCVGNIIGFAYRAGVVGGDAICCGATQEISNRSSQLFAQRVETRDIDGCFGVAVAVKQ